MLSIFANVVTNLIQRRYAQRSKVPETIPTALSYLLGVMPVGIVVGLLLPHHITWNYILVGLLILCASSMAIGHWLGFKAVKRMSVTPYQTINRFTSVVTIGLGWIVLSETLGVNQLIGAIILFIAAIIAIWAPTRNTDKELGRVHLAASLLALVACTFVAIGLVAEKAMLDYVQVGAILIVCWGSQTVAMSLLMLKDLNSKTLSELRGYEVKQSFWMGLANGVSGAFYVYALSQSDNISVITALTAVSLPLTILGARYLLKEQERSKFLWLSLGLCFIGLLVSSL